MSLSDAVSGGLPGLSRYAGVMEQNTADATKAIKDAESGYQKTMDDQEKLRKGIIDKAEQPGGALVPPVLKPPPTPKSTEPVEIWGSSAMWMAALGGLLTRRPLTNALNAAAGVMSAFRQHDSEAAQAAYDTWKTETDNALTMFKFANESLKDSLSIINTTERVAFANFKVTAETLQDTAAMNVKDFDAAARLVEARQAHVDRMATAAGGMSLKYMQGKLQLGMLDAANALQAARASGDPKKIAAAQAELTAAQERFNAFKGKKTGLDALTPKDQLIYKTANTEIDRALAMLEKGGLDVTGLRGDLNRYYEGAVGQLGISKKAPSQEFETQILKVQDAMKRLTEKSAFMSKGALDRANEIVKGLGIWDTPESTRESLDNLKDILAEQSGMATTGGDDGGSGSGDDGGDLSGLSNEEILNKLQGP